MLVLFRGRSDQSLISLMRAAWDGGRKGGGGGGRGAGEMGRGREEERKQCEQQAVRSSTVQANETGMYVCTCMHVQVEHKHSGFKFKCSVNIRTYTYTYSMKVTSKYPNKHIAPTMYVHQVRHRVGHVYMISLGFQLYICDSARRKL